MKVTLKYILIIFTLIFVALEGFCGELDYKNNLLSVSFRKLSSTDVQVTLFMQKPYSEPLSVIKKGDFEYVIILADTYHSISSQPGISQVTPLITNVSVKLFPYLNNSNNGYTKISILSSTKLNVTAKAVSSTASASQDTMQSQLEALIAAKPKTETIRPKAAVKQSAKPSVKSTLTNKAEYKQSPKPKVIDVQKVLAQQNTQNIKTPQVVEKKEQKQIQTPQAQDNTATQAVEQPKNVTPELIKPTQHAKQIPRSNDFDYFIIFFVTISIIALCAMFLVYKLRKQKKENTFSDSKLKETMKEQMEILFEHKQQDKPDDIEIAAVEVEDVDFSVVPTNSAFEDYLNKPEEKEESEEPDDFDGIELLGIDTPYNEVQYKVVEEKTQDDDNKVLSTYKIDDASGFYLSTYEHQIVLLGYIDDSLFVLDKFEYDDTLKVNAKLVQNKDDSQVYLVKVGRKRAFYEVSKYNISLTLEL